MSIFLFSSPPNSPGSSDTDENLARQSRANPQAFGELYKKHMMAIYRYHLARTGNEQDAQDLTAQTFLAALENISSYRGQNNFLSWLYGIARHKVADHYHRQPMLSLEEAAPLLQSGQTPEEEVIAHLQISRVAKVLCVLTTERAEAIILRFFCGLSAAETGQVMARSESAVKMLVFRGLSDLQERLTPVAGTPGTEVK